MLSIKNHELERMTAYIQKHYGINLSQKKNLIEGRLNSVSS